MMKAYSCRVFLAVKGVGSPPDAGSLFRVREVDAVSVCDPRFPSADTAMVSFANSVDGCVLDERDRLGEDGATESGLVSFGVHDVVESSSSGDVLGGVMLGVRSVHRDDYAFSLAWSHRSEEGFDLGDLVGVWRHLDLGDGDALAVGHRGEQREPLVLVGPDTAEYLAVYREPKCSVIVALGAFP